MVDNNKIKIPPTGKISATLDKILQQTPDAPVPIFVFTLMDRTGIKPVKEYLEKQNLPYTPISDIFAVKLTKDQTEKLYAACNQYIDSIVARHEVMPKHVVFNF